MLRVLALFVVMSGAAWAQDRAAETASVRVVQTPDGGIQPQAVVSADGTLHLLYYKGDPKAGDLFYTRRPAGAGEFAPAVRVNSVDGSAVAIGNDRGGHLAMGRNNAVHVAWNGSGKASEKGSHERSPMLYARMAAGSSSFEPQRNLMTVSGVLDGGGSVAADAKGNVYVVWHGVPEGSKDRGEAARRVFVAASRDDGATFATEAPVSAPQNGACGCCGLRAGTDGDGNVLILYRAAEKGVNRDMHLLRSSDTGKTFSDTRLDGWNLKACPMTTASITYEGSSVVLAWETQEDVRWMRLKADGSPGEIHPAPQPRNARRRYPSAAIDAKGNVLLAWAEGMAWGSGGSVHWAVFDAAGKPIPDSAGNEVGVPAWGLVGAFAGTGEFVVLK